MSSKSGIKAGSSSIRKENLQEKELKLKEQFQHFCDGDLGFAKRKTMDMINKLHTKIAKAFGQRKEGLLNYIEAL